jgi:hypothetical protein
MINEYAVDPRIVSSWERLQRLLSQFGFDKHRLIARVPGRWRSAVLESLPESLGDTERSRIVARLKDFENLTMVARPHTWNQNDDWLQNVSRIHELENFALILTAGGIEICHPFVPYVELDESSPPLGWLVSGRVERSRDGMVKALRLVLQSAKKAIKFVEPHFHPDTTRFSNAFEAYLSCICDCAPTAQVPAIELHTSDKHEGQLFRKKCEHFFSSRLPTGSKLRVVRWPQHRLHNRYVLSEKACVIFGVGTDENEKGNSGVDFDNLKLLNERERVEIDQDYDASKSRFGKREKGSNNDFEVEGTLSKSVQDW